MPRRYNHRIGCGARQRLQLRERRVHAGICCRLEVERLTGVRIVDVHIGDAKNLTHPWFFDNTGTYEIVVFRGPSPQTTVDAIVTRPMTFFNFDKLLITVRAVDSRSVPQVKPRFVNVPGKMPQSPDDLMQRPLTIITAIFMPATLITGLFGMNFDFMPGLHKSYGFWLSVAAMIGIVAGMLVCFRRRRWV